MSKFKSDNCQSVNVETIDEAAEIFANRLARRWFGRRGYCRTKRQNCYTPNGRMAEYDAFIGITTGRNETTGRNITFAVRKIAAFDAKQK